MLAVLLSILKFIGLALLWILGIVLALLLILLLCPITYRVEGEGRDGNLVGLARGSYLLGLVRFGFCYPEPGKPYLKILWMDLLNRKGKAKEDGKAEKKAEEKTHQKVHEKALEKVEDPEEAPQLDSDTSQEPVLEENLMAEEPASESGFKKKDKEKKTKEKKTKEKKKKEEKTGPRKSPEEVVKNLKEKVLRLQGKLKRLLQEYHFYQNLLEDEQTKGLLAKGKKHLFRILKKIFPRKVHVEGRFGSGSPDTTGYVFGLYALFAGRFDKGSRLEPDFEEKILDGKVRAKGYFNLWGILWNGVCVLLDKRLRLTRKRLKNHKELMEKRKDREEAAIAAELAE